MNLLTRLYYWIIHKPKPKFEIGDVVEINPEFKNLIVNDKIDLESMKMMVIVEIKWNRETGYITHVDTCNIFSSTQQIHEGWLQLRPLN